MPRFDRDNARKTPGVPKGIEGDRPSAKPRPRRRRPMIVTAEKLPSGADSTSPSNRATTRNPAEAATFR